MIWKMAASPLELLIAKEYLKQVGFNLTMWFIDAATWTSITELKYVAEFVWDIL